MSGINLLLSDTTWDKIKNYHSVLCQNDNIEQVGNFFGAKLTKNGTLIKDISIETFASLLIQSKQHCILPEEEVHHTFEDWTLTEKSILGDISAHIPVEMFNDGGHERTFSNYKSPIKGHLIYVPGALLATQHDETEDHKEVIEDGQINQDKFNALYERRLLPALLKANELGQSEGKQVAMTIPSIGREYLSGDYCNSIKNAFRLALEHVLKTHADRLTQISVIHYDAYNNDVEKNKSFQDIDFRTVVSSQNKRTTKQLAFPIGTSGETHTLVSLVEWDHFSWPGNIFWKQLRQTDGGVKAASTNTMQVITGIAGSYDKITGCYLPPKSSESWKDVAQNNHIVLSGELTVYPIAKPQPLVVPDDTPQKTSEASSYFIPGMQVLGGFISVMGIAAVAVSLMLLTLSTAGLATIIGVGLIGSAATLTGVGLFSTKYLTDNTPKDSPDNQVTPKTV